MRARRLLGGRNVTSTFTDPAPGALGTFRSKYFVLTDFDLKTACAHATVDFDGYHLYGRILTYFVHKLGRVLGRGESDRKLTRQKSVSSFWLT